MPLDGVVAFSRQSSRQSSELLEWGRQPVNTEGKIRGVFCHLVVVIYCIKLSKHGKTFRVRIRVSVRVKLG